MTFSELNNLLVRCLEKVGQDKLAASAILGLTGPVRTINYIACELWMRKVSDDEDTEALRSQLKHLDQHSKFDLTD